MDLEGLYNPERDGASPTGAQVIRNMGLDPDQLLNDALANARVLKETQIKTKPDNTGHRMVLNQVGPKVNGEVHYVVGHEKVDVPQQQAQVNKETEWDDDPDLDDPQECWFFPLTDEEKSKIKLKKKARKAKAAKSLFKRSIGFYSPAKSKDTGALKLQRTALKVLGMTFSGICTKSVADSIIDHSVINNPETGKQTLVKLPHDMTELTARVKRNKYYNIFGNAVGNAMTTAGSLTSTTVEASTNDMVGVVAARVARIGAHFAKDTILGNKIIKDFSNLNTDKIYTELVSDNTNEAEGVTNFLKLMKKHEILEAAATTGVDFVANIGEGLLALSDKTSKVSEMLSSCAPVPGVSSAIKYGLNSVVLGNTAKEFNKYLGFQESRDLIGMALEFNDSSSVETESFECEKAPVYDLVELAKNAKKKRKI